VFSHFIFWPWFAGVVILAMGLISVRGEFAAAARLEKFIVLGRVFAAAPLAVFGAEHFLNVRAFSPAVPGWIPFHPFWIVFVGVALFAGALSLAWNRYTRLASMLLAIMIFVFVLTIHIPRVAASHDRISWAVVLRDTAFAGGFLAFSGSHAPRSKALILVGRVATAIPFLFFVVMHILHPQNAPGVPLEKLTPAWMPWPHVLATITALFLLAAGVAILIDRYARTAAAWLGVWMVYLTLVLYLPILLTAQGGMQLIEGVNYVFDTLMFAGTILLLASALPEKRASRIALVDTVRSQVTT
jgi:uncharacterized membrane protein YphA (DoxX/SURF4 family)